MTLRLGCISLKLALSSFAIGSLLLPVSQNRAVAQITPDNTLPNNSIVIPNGNTNVIIQGTTVGNNLFHSFSQFSVLNGTTAYFNNNSSIQNILTRVTGGSASTIDGVIRANGAANLFLLNPSGILFGPGASLNIGGSFVASTADSLRFADGTAFSAINPLAQPLLTVSVPVGLQYGGNGQAINVQGSNLAVNSGKSLILAGGNVNIDSATLTVASGNVDIGAISAGNLGLNVVGNNFWLSVPSDTARSNVSMSNSAINVSANQSGSISVYGQNLFFSNTALENTTFGGKGGSISVDATQDLKLVNSTIGTSTRGVGVGADVFLKAKQINIVANSLVTAQTNSLQTGKGGNITIVTDGLLVEDGSQVLAGTFGAGDGGDLTINAQDIQLFGFSISANGLFPSGLFTGAQPGSTGNGGTLTISTNTLTVANRAIIDSSTSGKGRGGDLIINANSILVEDISTIGTGTFAAGDGGNLTITAQDIQLIGTSTNSIFPTGLFSSAQPGTTGNAGDINIATDTLFASGGAQVSTSTFGKGNGGNLTIKAQNIELIGTSEDLLGVSGLFSSAQQGSTGQAGEINVTTDTLLISGTGQIRASTSGVGDGGKLTIFAKDIVLKDVATINTSTDGLGNAGTLVISTNTLVLSNEAQIDARTFGVGNGGQITITAQDIVVQDGSLISTSSFGAGNAGNIVITAKDIKLIGTSVDGSLSGIFATAQPGSTGNAGNLTISADTLLVTNGAGVSTITLGTGAGGNLTIAAQDFELQGRSRVLTATTGAGNAGNLTITANNFVVQDGSQISTATAGAGNAGDLTITAQDIKLTGTSANGFPSGLFSSAELGSTGTAGNLTISTNTLLVAEEGQIASSTFGVGNAGNLTITAKDIKLTGTSANGELASGLFATAQPGSTGNAGNLTITTNSLFLADGAVITTSTDGSGKGGQLTIAAQDIAVEGGSQIATGTTGAGDAGDLTITAQDIKLTGMSEDGKFSSGLFSSADPGSTGNAGDILIATNSLFLVDEAVISAATSGSGKGGQLTIAAQDLAVEGGSQIDTTSFGAGDAGDLTITAKDINLSGTSTDGKFQSGLFARAALGSTGNAGGINITTENIEIQNGAVVNINNRGSGEAGNIEINANTLNLNGGSIFGIAGGLAIGNGSSITINANDLTATNGGSITTSTFGASNAGSINLNIANDITLSGMDSGIFANTEAGSTGKGGSIVIDPNTVTIRDRAAISVNSQGTGDGGNIKIEAGTLTLDNGSISAATTSSNGGEINLKIDGLSYLTNSQISATAGGTGTGGNLSFDTGFLIATNNSTITANAFQGDGGRIQITTQGLFLSPDSTISASSELGIDGNVQLNTPDVDPSRGLAKLPESVVDVSNLVARRCNSSLAHNESESEFVITGRGGLPPNPGDPLKRESTLTQWATLPPNAAASAHVPDPNAKSAATKRPAPIIKAEEWVVDAAGKVTLTAEPTGASLSSQGQATADCHS